MRLHVVALPHTETSTRYLHCAYTQKVVKFCDMMSAQGHDVYLYAAGEENEADCVEHVSLISPDEQRAWFGEWSENTLFGEVDWNPETLPWVAMNGRAVEAIRWRAEPHDLVCLTMGWSQKPIADALDKMLSVEWAVGYEGIALNYRVFESYAWMHYLYGVRHHGDDGRSFDAVIPNFFDQRHFYDVEDTARPAREGFLLYVGRMITRKGVEEAAEIARRTGRKLYLAGPGVLQAEPGKVMTLEFTLKGDVEWIGTLDVGGRADWMARAHAVLTPTRYVEPFGGVAVEAMMSGTPVIATDFGAFTETVVPGVTGYRFHTIREAVDAVDACGKLDPATIQQHARSRYALGPVGEQFTQHFERLNTLWGEGFYA